MSTKSRTTPENAVPASDSARHAGLVLAHVVRQTFAREHPAPRKPLSEPVAAAIGCMLARHRDTLTVADLAREAGLSRFHFTRRFRREAGITPGAFLRRLRIARATELLDATSSSVARAMRNRRRNAPGVMPASRRKRLVK